MEFAIRLSCILALFFCLASTGNAAAVDQDRQKIQELLRRSEQNSDPNTQLGITYDAVQIYNKYRGLEKSGAVIETELDTKVNEFESKIELVEGVPVQGGGFGKFFAGFFSKVGKSSQGQDIIEEIAEYFLYKMSG